MDNVKSNKLTSLSLEKNQLNIEMKLNAICNRMDQLMKEMKISNDAISKLRISNNLSVALEKKHDSLKQASAEKFVEKDKN